MAKTKSRKNGQWKVTSYGLETVKPAVPYAIKASLLTRPRGNCYDWPLHLAEKGWVSLSEFEEAFKKAVAFHKGKYSPEYDSKVLAASMVYAWHLRSGGH